MIIVSISSFTVVVFLVEREKTNSNLELNMHPSRQTRQQSPHPYVYRGSQNVFFLNK